MMWSPGRFSILTCPPRSKPECGKSSETRWPRTRTSGAGRRPTIRAWWPARSPGSPESVPMPRVLHGRQLKGSKPSDGWSASACRRTQAKRATAGSSPQRPSSPNLLREPSSCCGSGLSGLGPVPIPVGLRRLAPPRHRYGHQRIQLDPDDRSCLSGRSSQQHSGSLQRSVT